MMVAQASRLCQTKTNAFIELFEMA